MKPRTSNSNGEADADVHKPHRQRQSGRKALKKRTKESSSKDSDDPSSSKAPISRTTNYKAFSIQHPVKYERTMRRYFWIRLK